MSQRANILEELGALNSSLADQPAQAVFAVPEGYFDSLADSVLKRIQALESSGATEELEILSPILNNISRELPYQVPVGYFDQLDEKLSLVMEEDELSGLSPLLAGMEKKMPYMVPKGYFENLTGVKNRKAKVISMTARRWYRFAVAAVVTGIILMAGLIYFNTRPDPIEEPYTWVKKSIKKVDKAEIEELVNLADQELTGGSSRVSIPRSEEIKELMKDVTDKELQEFLNETPDMQSVDEMILN